MYKYVMAQPGSGGWGASPIMVSNFRNLLLEHSKGFSSRNSEVVDHMENRTKSIFGPKRALMCDAKSGHVWAG